MYELILMVHVVSGALWVGALFMNVLIVWPAAYRWAAGTGFPRSIISLVGMKSAPWLYLGMAGLALSGLALAALDGAAASGLGVWLWVKIAAATYMIANNVHGTIVTWPKVMLSPETRAWSVWRIYHARAALALLVGILAMAAPYLQRLLDGAAA